MITNQKRETIINFLFNTLPNDQMALAADIILKDEALKEIYEEEKKKVKIHQYVEKELLPFEEIEFKYQMSEDKSLAREVKLREKINISLECMMLKDKLDEIFNEKATEEEIPVVKLKPNYTKYTKWVAAAIVTLLLTVGGMSYHINNRDSLENRLYYRYYKPFSEHSKDYIFNGSSYIEAKKKYLEGEYKNALLLLKEQPESIIIKIERDFFIGLSLLEVHQYDKALKIFEQALSAQKEFEHFPQIRWYLALSYLKTGNNEKAIEVFNIIVNNRDYNYKKAKRILRKLE